MMPVIKIYKRRRKLLEKCSIVYVGIILWIYQLGISSVLGGKCGRPGRTASSSNFDTNKKEFNENETIHYKCVKEDDTILGVSERRCQQNGRWSDEIPVCSKTAKIERLECLYQDTPLELHLSADKNISTCIDIPQYCGSTGIIYLSSLVNITAVRISVLGTDDTYSSIDVIIEENTGKEKKCETKQTVVETTAKSTKTTTFYCPAGTAGNIVHIKWGNHGFSICEVSVFLPPVPQCLKPDTPLYGMGLQYASTNGTEYRFHCDTGYKRWGAFEVFCHIGTWTPESPICDEIYCNIPDDPENGYVVFDSHKRGVPFNGTAIYSCKEGYRLVGISKLTCFRWNEWNYSPPVCKSKTPETSAVPKSTVFTESRTEAYEIYCDIPDDPPNGYVTYDSNIRGVPFNGTAKYSCNEGYQLVGRSIITCYRWKEWDNSPPICEPKILDITTVPKSTVLTKSKTETNGTKDTCGTLHIEAESHGKWKSLHGSSSFLVLVCPEHFHIKGSPPVIQCLPNGSWSYSNAICEKSFESEWGSNWSSKWMLTAAIAAGAGTAVLILCLSVAFLVIKKRRQTRTNTTVFQFENGSKKNSLKEINIRRQNHHSAAEGYESIIERRSKSASINLRTPHSALPNLPLDTDPVYAQPFETASAAEKLSGLSSINRKDDLYNTHIYAEPVDSRKPAQCSIPPNIPALRTVTDPRASAVKTNFKNEPPLPASIGAQNCAKKCAIYDSSESSRLNNSVATDETHHRYNENSEVGTLPKKLEYLELL